jgi:hypothetical protein
VLVEPVVLGEQVEGLLLDDVALTVEGLYGGEELPVLHVLELNHLVYPSVYAFQLLLMFVLDLAHLLFVGSLLLSDLVLFVDVHFFCAFEGINEVVFEFLEGVGDIVLYVFEL